MSDDEYQLPPLLLTMPQAAALCQVGLDRIREWTHLPGFPAIRTDHQVRIHARLLDQWLADRAMSTQENAA
jgi:excisionase family DNA binding protein